MLFLLILIFFLLNTCGTTQDKPENNNMSVVDEIDAAPPKMNSYPDVNPGESSPIERNYFNEPPAIPHNINESLINLDNNYCVSCHSFGIELGEGHVATIIPDFHKNEVESSNANIIKGTFYNCLQCHVRQSEQEYQDNK